MTGTEAFTVTGMILGGLGLFLLAVSMMTDGLRQAAGESLRKILSEWTRTPLRGVFSGLMMTAIVQSSSAVTVASIGFVNAGLIGMRKALGIIYGANIGTTMTGWLVALVGFKVNIQAFALPMIGIGMLLRLTGRDTRRAAIGLALVGFGLFFVGVDVLKTAFEGVVESLNLASFGAEGVRGIVIFLFLGIAMTVLTQSSSAAIALVITAASTGVVGLHAAAAMVIGANVGTTSTAVLSAIGATSNAKRVAFAQVLFNVGTAIVALLILPLIFYMVDHIGTALEMEASPGVRLALFHTVFNVLGVLLVFPLNDRLARFLETRFVTYEEVESNPRYLDKTIAVTPVLAVNALVMELKSIGEKVAAVAGKAMNPAQADIPRIGVEVGVIQRLSGSVTRFVVRLERGSLGEGVTRQLASLMRVDQYLVTCANLSLSIAKKRKALGNLHSEVLDYNLDAFCKLVEDLMGVHLFEQDFETLEGFDEQFYHVQEVHDQLKAELLMAGTASRLQINEMMSAIDLLARIQQLSQQWFKAIKTLQRLHAESDTEAGSGDDDENAGSEGENPGEESGALA
ncbi:Na/Pi cotransporter family protein [Biformimicrobium ophioploci]|uniref:Na/Pi cotransporter family protein n=1 Tax=Biformimicrobium ophioploci TaxID=3036711 RepID=A0ABQ6LYD6_9GAMM|nr:Na/Pi cotransporter family protein [Microbulbifer sp. NKW57]GMG87068.1 hypothetical protein MNKW57_13890 [Microbulbifer sp. NKW57]